MSHKTVSTAEASGLIGAIIYNEYRVVKRLGGGSFGDIYLGVGAGGKKVAIKFEAHGTRCPQLRHEYKVYRELQHCEGIGTVSFYGTHDNYNVMVMDLLGSSLEDLFVQCDRQFSLKTVLQLADQLLERIETMHSKHLVHRDVKPANFVLGLDSKCNTVFGIDFGLSSRYRHPKTLQHIPYREGRSLTGTPRFASINNHLGIEQSRRDDLESIGYVLIYFLKGSLPWQGLKARSARRKYKMIMDKKQAVSIQQLCEGLPQQFAEYLLYCRGLKFDAKPNILYLRRLFRDLYTSRGYGPNKHGRIEWDWIKKDPFENVWSYERPHVRSLTTPDMPNSFVQQTAVVNDLRPVEGTSQYNLGATQKATVGTPPLIFMNGDSAENENISNSQCKPKKAAKHLYTNSLPAAPLSPGRNFHRSAKSTVEDVSKGGNEAADFQTRQNGLPSYNVNGINALSSRHGFATMPGLPRRESSSSLRHRKKWYKWGSRFKPKYLREYFKNARNFESKKSKDKSPRALDSGGPTSKENENQCDENGSNVVESRCDGRTDHQIDDNWNSNNCGGVPLQTLPSMGSPGRVSASPNLRSNWWSQDGSRVPECEKNRSRSIHVPSARSPSNKRSHFKKLKFISRNSFSRAATSSNVVA